MRNQTSIPQRTKDPEEALVYGFDWTDALEAGESIASSNWELEGTEQTIALEIDPGSETIDTPNNKTAVRITAGTLGQVYKLKNTVTTSPSSDIGVRRIELRIIKK